MRTARSLRDISLLLAVVVNLAAQNAAVGQASVPSTPPPFSPRMSTVVDNVVGLGDDAPQARIILHLEGNDLCLFIAISPDPKQLQAGLFRFKRKIEGERKLETLEFRLPEKPATREEDKVKVWETCLEDIATEQAIATALGDSFIEMTYRDPRPYAKPAQTTLSHPIGILPIGIDVFKDSGGSLHFSLYDAATEMRSESPG